MVRYIVRYALIRSSYVTVFNTVSSTYIQNTHFFRLLFAMLKSPPVRHASDAPAWLYDSLLRASLC